MTSFLMVNWDKPEAWKLKWSYPNLRIPNPWQTSQLTTTLTNTICVRNHLRIFHFFFKRRGIMEHC